LLDGAQFFDFQTGVSEIIHSTDRQVDLCGLIEECLLVYRTKGEYWGKGRTVIVTYNPSSRRKQEYTFDDKLEVIRRELLSMRTKVRDKAPHWRKQDAVKERYLRLCERMHIPSELHELTFEN
jgi:hypothetical protein